MLEFPAYHDFPQNVLVILSYSVYTFCFCQNVDAVEPKQKNNRKVYTVVGPPVNHCFSSLQ